MKKDTLKIDGKTISINSRRVSHMSESDIRKKLKGYNLVTKDVDEMIQAFRKEFDIPSKDQPEHATLFSVIKELQAKKDILESELKKQIELNNKLADEYEKLEKEYSKLYEEQRYREG